MRESCVGAHACNPSTREVDAEASQVQGQLLLHVSLSPAWDKGDLSQKNTHNKEMRHCRCLMGAPNQTVKLWGYCLRYISLVPPGKANEVV